MSDFIHVRTDEAWKKFSHFYLIKNSFCVMCEDKGKATYATIVYQPTPDEDSKKKRFREYNLKPLCAECYYSIQINQVIKSALQKALVLATVLTVIGILIKIIF